MVAVLDSWGVIPSERIFNTFEMGSFTQCFQIERNGIEYRTKYCLPYLEFEPAFVYER